MKNWKPVSILYSALAGLAVASPVLAEPNPSNISFYPTIGAASPSTSIVAQTPSFFGWKKVVYQFAPHTQREDLLPAFSRQQGSDPALTFQGPPLNGITPSGQAPIATGPASQPQAKQYLQGQPVAHPFMQRALTIDGANPLKTHWGPPLPGQVPPFLYVQANNPDPSGMNAQTFSNLSFLNGGSLSSDLIDHLSMLSVSEKAAGKMLDPNLQSAQAAYQGGAQQTADAASQDVSGAFQGNLGQITQTLINVADENASSQAHAGEAHRTLSQAIWILQQMFKRFFMPLSLLLLLVGAVSTQSTNYVRYTFVDSTEVQNQVAQPFEGIIRAVMAIFFICGIPLAVSYFIDFGNAITAPIEQMIDNQSLVSWQQGFSNPTQNMSAAQAYQYWQSESTAAATGRVAFNSVQALLNSGLMVLTQYQIVMVCYLYLLGPIAAAFYAWPAVGTKYRTAFATWLNGMSNLVMWRFWWCVILLCMTTRIRWLQDMGSYDPHSAWEPIVYTAFMAILTYVPFAALDFRPGDMVDSLLKKGTQSSS